MFTPSETPLLTGSPEEIEAFLDSDLCLVVDGRGSEEEALEDLASLLPEDSLSFEIDFPDAGNVEIQLRFLERRNLIALPLQPRNNFRVLLHAAALLEPDYEIGLFRCTTDSDTQVFLVRPRAWWQAYRAGYSRQHAEVFVGIARLQQLWKLDDASARGKPWWKFW